MASLNSCASVVCQLPQEQHFCLPDQPRFLVHTWEQALVAVAILASLLVLLHSVFEVRFYRGFTVSSFVYWD